MDKRKSVINVCVSVVLKVIAMIVVIVAKRYLILVCGNETNGLNALFLSIIGFLAVAELGVGSAISFSLYKPVVENDKQKVSALFRLFDRLYWIIGGIIFLLGLMVMPALPYLTRDYSTDGNLFFAFFLMLVSVVLTYAFGAKTALINAYKHNYITAAISLGGLIVQYVLQILVLLYTRSFLWYLVCRIVIAVIQWIVTEVICRKMYFDIISKKETVDTDTKNAVGRNIKAMFLHKIGFVLVNTVDNILISMFAGVSILGVYSNYVSILASITSVLNMIFTSLTSIVGHLFVKEQKETTQRFSEAFHLVNFLLGVVFFLGYYAVIDDLISLIFSENLKMDRSITFVVTINGFVQFMRQSVLLFRDATGTFYNDRWKPLIEGTFNLVISFLLIKWIGIAGVVIGTIVTNIFVCHIIEPYVLYKNAFGSSPQKYYAKNYIMIVLFTACLLVTNHCMQKFDDSFVSFLVNGCISVGISVIVCGIALLTNRKSFSILLKRKKSLQ